MSASRLVLATDQRERPIGFTQLLWSSNSAEWQGFGLELHRVGPRGVLKDFGVPDTLLGLCVAGAADIDIRCATTQYRTRIVPGRFILLGRGGVQPSIAWSGTRDTLYVRLAAAQIQQFVPHAAGALQFDVAPQFGVADAQVQRLLLCMADEARTGAPTGAAYAQALSIALAERLLGRYGRATTAATKHVPLSPARMTRIRDFVQANLGRDVSLPELAEVGGLSPHYFLHVFKRAFGVTPHRYLIEQRIAAARSLLRDDALSITEVALALGFADQSHFTATFRRVTGSTPSRFRREA